MGFAGALRRSQSLAVLVSVTVAQLTHSPALPAQTRPNFAIMSDLCPVYAPFFGAMVRFHDHSGSFVREPLIHPSFLFDCRVVPVPSCLHVRLLRCRISSYPAFDTYPRYWSEASFFSFRIAHLPLSIPPITTSTFATYDFTPQLWDRKGWCWHFSHVCITTGSYDEEHRSRRHGWYHRCECLYARRTETMI